MNNDQKEVSPLEPKILWKGTDVTRLLYGPAVIVPNPAGILSWSDDPRVIKEQVGRTSGEAFGVVLKTIDSPAQLKTGDLLLNIRCGESGLIKSIIQITDIDGDNIFTKSRWPEYDSGFEGFSRSKYLFEIQDYPNPNLYFIYRGKIPEKPLKPSLYERMAEFQSDLGVLIECWTMVKNPDFIKQNFFSFDPYLNYWEEEFGKGHGREFQHRKVWEILSSVKESGSLTEIEEIFSQRKIDLEGWGKDLINPLLGQMQYEILAELRYKPDLVEIIFSQEASEFWLKRMRIIFERYYGPKQMVFVAEVPPGKQETPPKRPLDEKTQRRLEVIREIIKGTRFEGVREAAKAAWERLTGYPYQK